MDDALPEDLFSAKEFPKTFVWFGKYTDAISKAMKQMESGGKVRQLKGEAAVKEISEGPFGEKQLSVDKRDPTGLKEGEIVHGYPQDTGFTRRDKGQLVGLTMQEGVISTKAQSGAEIRVHHPRWNFAIERASASSA